MSTALAEKPDAQAIEQTLVSGDLSRLSPAHRLTYYNQVCTSLGLNPLTKPFAYITLNGKLTLYALKDCTEQLRNNRSVSVQIMAREVAEDCYVVTARASLPSGRQDESIGAVSIGGLKGENRANAMMKAETKAKRRVTLSICGLGMLDETEIETIKPGTYSVEPLPAPRTEPDLSTAHSALRPSEPNGGDSATHPGFEATQHGEEIPADGKLYIARVDHTPTKNKNVTKHLITFSDGRQASTIRQPLAALCDELCQLREAVTFTAKESKYGLDLMTVERAEEFDAADSTSDEHRDLIGDDDIPFVWLLPFVLPALGLIGAVFT